MSKDACLAVYDPISKTFISDNQICAGTPQADTCSGDSGRDTCFKLVFSCLYLFMIIVAKNTGQNHIDKFLYQNKIA